MAGEYFTAPSRPVLVASSVVNQRTIASVLFIDGGLCLLNTSPAKLYAWNSTNSDADDGDITIRPNDVGVMAAGRWKKIQTFGSAGGVVGHKQDELPDYSTIANGSYVAHGAFDDNPVTAAQNVLIHSTSYTTKSATSFLKIAAFVVYAGSPGTVYIGCLHSPSLIGGNAIVVAPGSPGAGNLPSSLGTFSRYILSPGAAVAMTINLRFGQVNANNGFYINGGGNGPGWDGGSRTWIEITEYDFG